jgi:hypothetical protein
MALQRRQAVAHLSNDIDYHKHQSDYHTDMAEYHDRQFIEAQRNRELLLSTITAPLIAEFTDIRGNIVANGKYVPAYHEYITNRGQKIAHWNTSLCKIVPVAAVRSKLASWNKRADPVAHQSYLENQRARYRETHPIRANLYINA